METKIECKLICEDDLERIMIWRMRPEITKNMRTHPVLTIEKQKVWFEKISKEDKQYHWMIRIDKIPIGVINIHDIDWEKKSCSTGIYIAEKGGGPGLFFELHWNLFDFVFDEMQFCEISAEALDFNKAVIMLNKRLWPTIIKQKGCLTYHITKKQWNEIRKGKTYQKIIYEKKEYEKT